MAFSELFQLAEFVAASPVSKNGMRALFNSESEEDPFRIAYEGILNKEIKNEDELSETLLGTGTNSRAYREFKHQFVNRLMNMSFHFQLKNNKAYPPYFYSQYACLRKLFTAEVLISSGKRKVAAPLLEQALRIAGEIQFTFVEFESAYLLANHYAQTNQPGKLAAIEKQLTKSLDDLKVELEARSIFNQLSRIFKASASSHAHLKPQVNEWRKKLRKLSIQCPRFNVVMFYHRVNLMYYQQTQQYNLVISECAKVEQYLSDNSIFRTPARRVEFTIQKINAYLHLKDYEKGFAFARECEGLFNSKTSNWFIYREQYFLLSLYSRKYRNAVLIFSNTVRNTAFERQEKYVKEKWQLFQAYLELLLPAKENVQLNKRVKKLNHLELLNSTKLLDKDKHGYHIAITMVSALLLLKNSEYSILHVNEMALKRFRDHYLRKQINKRHWLVIRFIFFSMTNQKDMLGLRQEADNLRMSLRSYTEQAEETEIIPYEILLQEVMKKLVKQKQLVN